MMKQESITYESSGKAFKGTFFYDDSFTENRPVVIVAHAWMGQDHLALEKAKLLASLGYIGFAADVYGDGVSVSTNEEAKELMVPLFMNRVELRSRIVAAYNAAKALKIADPNRIGAIGFCFGGLTVIELLRSGVDIRGVASFHGLLGHTFWGMKAERHREKPPIKGSLLILNGHDDPLVTPEDVREIQDEMTQAQVDWEMDDYGLTRHAFTNPEATDPSSPLLYSEKSAQRSWQRMTNFFHTII